MGEASRPRRRVALEAEPRAQVRQLPQTKRVDFSVKPDPAFRIWHLLGRAFQKNAVRG